MLYVRQFSSTPVHEYLLQKGADVNATGHDKKTPLHEACNMRRFKNVKVLLQRREMRVNEVDNDQLTPLYRALCSMDEKHRDQCIDSRIVYLPLEREDTDVNVCDGIAVQEAARKGMLDVVENMVTKHKANLLLKGGRYGSVLQAAPISGDRRLVDLLLRPEYHVDVNIRGSEFGKAVAATAAFGHEEIVQSLLDATADPNVVGVGRYGSAYQSVCKKRGGGPLKSGFVDNICKLLQKYGGRDIMRQVDMPYATWRWDLSLNRWGWVLPGEM